MNDRLTVLQGDALEKLRGLGEGSIQCCVTSPPYWGLRDYGSEGQIGLEKTPEEYVEKMVSIFREVRRVLKKDGTLWLNLGDSYASGKGTCFNPGGGDSSLAKDRKAKGAHPLDRGNKSTLAKSGLKTKDLIGIPWMVAFALRSDGWYLLWAKANCMPESVLDRPTRSHEHLFLLTKSPRYFYDAEAIKEPASEADRWDSMEKAEQCSGMRNKRDVWTVAPSNYPEAHFATFPSALITPCILAGSLSPAAAQPEWSLSSSAAKRS